MLFVYGTLQDADILAAVLGRSVPPAHLRPARAPEFAVVAFPGRVYPALVPRPQSSATGLLLSGLEPMDLAVLDAFEGAEYRRAGITVRADGALVAADAYLPTVAMPANSPDWALHDWTARHKRQVLDAETDMARSLRDRLSERR